MKTFNKNKISKNNIGKIKITKLNLIIINLFSVFIVKFLQPKIKRANKQGREREIIPDRENFRTIDKKRFIYLKTTYDYLLNTLYQLFIFDL